MYQNIDLQVDSLISKLEEEYSKLSRTSYTSLIYPSNILRIFNQPMLSPIINDDFSTYIAQQKYKAIILEKKIKSVKTKNFLNQIHSIINELEPNFDETFVNLSSPQSLSSISSSSPDDNNKYDLYKKKLNFDNLLAKSLKNNIKAPLKTSIKYHYTDQNNVDSLSRSQSYIIEKPNQGLHVSKKVNNDIKTSSPINSYTSSDDKSVYSCQIKSGNYNSKGIQKNNFNKHSNQPTKECDIYSYSSGSDKITENSGKLEHMAKYLNTLILPTEDNFNYYSSKDELPLHNGKNLVNNKFSKTPPFPELDMDSSFVSTLPSGRECPANGDHKYNKYNKYIPPFHKPQSSGSEVFTPTLEDSLQHDVTFSKSYHHTKKHVVNEDDVSAVHEDNSKAAWCNGNVITDDQNLEITVGPHKISREDEIVPALKNRRNSMLRSITKHYSRSNNSSQSHNGSSVRSRYSSGTTCFTDTKLGAFVQGFLVRRLMKTVKITNIKTTIKDTMSCLYQIKAEKLSKQCQSLNSETHDKFFNSSQEGDFYYGQQATNELKQPPSDFDGYMDNELEERLTVQLASGLEELHSIFFKQTTGQRMKIVQNDRNLILNKLQKREDEERKKLALKKQMLGAASTNTSFNYSPNGSSSQSFHPRSSFSAKHNCNSKSSNTTASAVANAIMNRSYTGPSGHLKIQNPVKQLNKPQMAISPQPDDPNFRRHNTLPKKYKIPTGYGRSNANGNIPTTNSSNYLTRKNQLKCI